MLSRPAGFILYGNIGVDFFTTFEMPYPNMKIRLRLFRARLEFHMISEIPNISFGIVDCAFYTGSVALKDAYHKKQIVMLAYTAMEFN